MQTPGGPLAWALFELSYGSLLFALSDHAEAMAGPQEVERAQEVLSHHSKAWVLQFLLISEHFTAPGSAYFLLVLSPVHHGAELLEGNPCAY